MYVTTTRFFSQGCILQFATPNCFLETCQSTRGNTHCRSAHATAHFILQERTGKRTLPFARVYPLQLATSNYFLEIYFPTDTREHASFCRSLFGLSMFVFYLVFVAGNLSMKFWENISLCRLNLSKFRSCKLNFCKLISTRDIQYVHKFAK